MKFRNLVVVFFLFMVFASNVSAQEPDHEVDWDKYLIPGGRDQNSLGVQGLTGETRVRVDYLDDSQPVKVLEASVGIQNADVAFSSDIPGTKSTVAYLDGEELQKLQSDQRVTVQPDGNLTADAFQNWVDPNDPKYTNGEVWYGQPGQPDDNRWYQVGPRPARSRRIVLIDACRIDLLPGGEPWPPDMYIGNHVSFITLPDVQAWDEMHAYGMLGSWGQIKNNSLGSSGFGAQYMQWGATSVVVVCAARDGYITWSKLSYVLEMATHDGSDVVMAIPYSSTSDVPDYLKNAINAANASGIEMAFSAGNNGDAGGYPARLPNVICVSAVGRDGVPPSWSSSCSNAHGKKMAGIGVDIPVIWPDHVDGGGYHTFSGTSPASISVAARIAEAQALYNLSPRQARDFLLDRTQSYGGNSDWGKLVTSGSLVVPDSWNYGDATITVLRDGQPVSAPVGASPPAGKPAIPGGSTDPADGKITVFPVYKIQGTTFSASMCLNGDSYSGSVTGVAGANLTISLVKTGPCQQVMLPIILK